MIIETCPKCGHDLWSLMLTCNPPIPQKRCSNPDCDFCWTGPREEVVRMPFNPEDCVLSVLNSDLESLNNEVITTQTF